MAEYTIDFNRGNDSNDGITAPWKNLSKLAGTFANGDIVILDDESTWDFAIDGRQVLGTLNTRFTLTRSGTNGSQKPTLRRKPEVAAGSWTYDVGNNGWYYDIGFVPGVMTGMILGGEHWAQRQEAALPLTTADYCWKESGNRVYLYAPAGQDPTTYYGGVVMCSGDRGLLTFSGDGNDVLVDGIAFDDYGLGILLYANTGVRQYTVRNCETNGGKLVHVNTDTAGTLTAIIEYNRCRIAPCAFIQTLGSVGQGKHIIRYNDLATCNLGYPQGAIYLQNRDAGALVYGNLIEDAKWGSPYHTIDGCAIYTETGANNTVVFGNRVRNCHVAFQDNSGRTSTWTGNVVENCWAAMRVGDEQGNNATKHRFLNNTCINMAYPIPPYGPTTASGIGWRTIDLTSDDYTIANNIFTKYPGSSDAQPAIETPESAAGGSSIANNLIYGFDAMVQNYLGGAASPTPTGTLTDDPLLDASYRPIPESSPGAGDGSPCLEAGTRIADVVLKDFYGKDITKTPDIGAVQVYPARAASAARGVITRSASTRTASGRRAAYG